MKQLLKLFPAILMIAAISVAGCGDKGGAKKGGCEDGRQGRGQGGTEEGAGQEGRRQEDGSEKDRCQEILRVDLHPAQRARRQLKGAGTWHIRRQAAALATAAIPQGAGLA